MTVGILLFFAIIFALVFVLRLAKIGALLAFLLAGVAVGPHGLGILESSSVWTFLGEVGMMFLWFTIGLELNFKRLWQMKKNIFGLGFSQVMMVVAVLFPVLFGLTSWTFMGMIMVALLLSMSSTSTDLQILAETNELHSPVGRQAFSVLLFQDLLAIPLLAILPVFAGKTFNMGGSVVDVLVLSAGIVLGVVLVGRYLINPLMRMVSKLKSKEVFLIAIMLNIVFWAVVLEMIGLPSELGAFLGGMLLSETIYRHQIKVEVGPYAILFMSLFFVSLGLGLDVSVLLDNWPIVLGGAAALVALKFFAIYIVARVRHVPAHNAFFFALVLAQGGEFGLLILQTMKSSGLHIIPTQHAEILISVIVLSIMTTPILVSVYQKIRKSGKAFKNIKDKKLNKKEQMQKNPDVVICGFGRVGQIVANMLRVQKIPYVAIDLSVDAVLAGQQAGLNVVYGDTSNPEILKTMGLSPGKTRAVVVALDNAWVAKSTIRAVFSIQKRAKIFSRARTLEESKMLMNEGVKTALPETIESSFILGQDVLTSIGIKDSVIENMLNDFRESHYVQLSKVQGQK